MTRGSGMSLARTLSLLTGSVIAACLLLVLGVAYETLTNAAIAGAAQGIHRGTRQLASVAETGIRQNRTRYRAAAQDPAIRRALAAAERGDAGSGLDRKTVADAQKALAQLAAPTDSGLPIELWSESGRRIVILGTDEPVIAESPTETRPLGAPRIPRDGLNDVVAADSLQFGRLYSNAGRVYYWLVAPVIERRTLLGYIAQQRRIVANPQVDQSIRALAGEGVSTYYHNVDGSGWATVVGAPASPSRRKPNDRSRAMRGSGDELLIAEEHINGTPLEVAMEYPLNDVIAAPRAAVRQIFMAGIVLLIAGMGAAMLIGRRVARPIAAIADGAEAIARGQYETRVASSGEQEIARLAASFNHMANEVAVAHRALEQQSEDARAANRAKSEFLATMSHELRTPLNAIAGYAELLEMGLRGPITDAQRRDLMRIRASGQHLLGLISGVLDLARIERGQVKYDIVPILIGPFLADLDTLVSPQAAAKSLTLEYMPSEPGLTVLADREKLRQVVLNLLSNAIRFTPSGGRVMLWATTIADRQVAVCVRDTGPGIPEGRESHVFEPFVQLDRSLTQPQEGLGLGLAISRDLARGMHGDLTLRSTPNVGATFILTLPRGPAGTNNELMTSGATPAIGSA